MSKKLEQLFDLPQSDDGDPHPTELTDTDQESAQDSSMIITDSLRELDKIERALPAVRGLEASDNEMDDLSEKATTGFNDLMDLGMNVDSRYAADIFSVASTMLGHAVTAKNAKINKKLKMIDLQLKKMRLDQQKTKEETDTPEATGVVVDRNELLNQILNRKSASDGNGKD